MNRVIIIHMESQMEFALTQIVGFCAVLKPGQLQS